MNLFKKSTAAVALVTLVSSVFTTGVSAYSTSEIEAANTLAQAGVIVDQSANPAAYNLDQNVLRQEIAAVARGIAGLPKDTVYSNVFSDVTETTPNTWAWASVNPLANAGLIAKNPTFRPEANISKAEAVGMVVKAAFGDAYAYDASKGTTWQEQVVAFAVANGIVSNFTNYDTAATRGFVFEAGANAMSSTEDEEMNDIICTLLGTCGTEEDNTSEEDDNTTVTTPVVTGGNVEVSLNPASPSSQTIPQQGLVTFGKFDVTAGSQDVSVNTITLKREGLSNRSDIKRVYFEKNGMRVSTRSNVSTDDSVLVSFNPALVVKAGATETIDLVVELRDTAPFATVGAEHAFSVQSVESSSNLVGGTARTALMRVGSYAVQTVTFVETALSVGTEYNISEKDVLLWEFELQTTGDRNNVFKSISLRNAGTADLASAVTNLAIYNDGKKVSTNVEVLGREVTFTVNSEIENGRNETYEIRGDILSADRINDTINFEIRYSTDLVVVEKETSFSAPIAWIATTQSFGTASIIGGDLLLSRDTSVGLNKTVSASTSDVVLLSAKFNAKEAVTLEDVRINYTTTVGSLASTFNSLRLVVNGKTISTYTPAATTAADAIVGASTFNFDASFTASELTTVQVLWNVKNNATTNTTFNVSTFAAADLWVTSKRYVSNDEVATINGSSQWVNLVIANSTLTLTRNDAIDTSNNTVVSGASDVTLLGFSARANDVSDVKITSVNASALYAGMSSVDVTNIRLYQGDVLLSTKNSFDFNGLNVVVPKNGAVNFKIVADFTNTIDSGDTLTLSLAANAVAARNVDSNQTVSSPVVNGQLLSFVDGGKAIITLNSNTAQRTIVTPSNADISVLKFDVEAEDDKLRVTDVYVSENSGNVDLTAALKNAKLVVDGRTIEGSVLDSNTIYFSIGNTSPVIVDVDQIKAFDLRVSFNDSTVRTNLAFDFGIEQVNGGAVAVNGTSNGMRIVSESNGEELILTDDGLVTGTSLTAAIDSKVHLLARSKVTVAQSSFTSSTNDLYKFTVTADSNRKVTLNSITMGLAGSADLTGATISVYKDSESAGNLAFTLNATGAQTAAGDVSNREVAAGVTNTYIVKITGASPIADSIREASITQVVYQDDVTIPSPISTSVYNVGVPTSVSSYKY